MSAGNAPLLASDIAWLDGKGLVWEHTSDGNGGGFLVIRNYPIDSARYDRDKVDVLLRIPSGYNDARLDMWWVDPPVRLKGAGFPQAADHMETHVGRTWQRFSRHLDGASRWRAGLDDLPRFMTLVARELQGG